MTLVVDNVTVPVLVVFTPAAKLTNVDSRSGDEFGPTWTNPAADAFTTVIEISAASMPSGMHPAAGPPWALRLTCPPTRNVRDVPAARRPDTARVSATRHGGLSGV